MWKKKTLESGRVGFNLVPPFLAGGTSFRFFPAQSLSFPLCPMEIILAT